MLDMRSRQTKQAKDEGTAIVLPWYARTVNGEPFASRHPPAFPQRTFIAPREGQDKIRRRRKKGPKILEKMPPITEMSHDTLNTAYRNSADNTELDVISEYEAMYPPRSASLMLQGHGSYHLAQGDISPSDKGDYIPYRSDDYTMHPGREVDLNQLRWKPSDTPYWRSPLQQVEDRLLDEVEEDLIIQEVNIGRHQAAKIDLDADVEALKLSHETMRHDFAKIEQHVHTDPQPDHVKEIQNGDDEDDLVSISSSIDTDEEPTVCVAQAKIFTNATGQVKPVMIPRRRRLVMPIGRRFENVVVSRLTNAVIFPALTRYSQSRLPKSAVRATIA